MSSRASAGLMLAVTVGWFGGSEGIVDAQTKSGDRPVTAASSDVAAVVQSGNQFAFDLYGHLRADHGNLFFSPASISTALSMAFAGASGETAAQMAKTLHCDMPKEQLNEAMRGLLATWKSQTRKQGYRLSVANRMWAQSGQNFLPAYLAVTRADYGAELGNLDFNHHAEQARQTINKWIEDQTEGKIKDLILSASQLTAALLVLTNAVYFKGEWTTTFKSNMTKDEDFHLGPERTVKAPLMHVRHRFGYAAADGVQILELPYGDGTLSMIVLLPEKKDGLADLEAKLNFGSWQHWTQNLKRQTVIVSLPRFKTSSQFGLRPVLEAMGMSAAFSTRDADFTGMTGSRDLYISAVLHKAYVDVNEEGTEAAAATGVIVGARAVIQRGPEPPVFRADHPFEFAIRDNRDGAILFFGRLADPTHP